MVADSLAYLAGVGQQLVSSRSAFLPDSITAEGLIPMINISISFPLLL